MNKRTGVGVNMDMIVGYSDPLLHAPSAPESQGAYVLPKISVIKKRTLCAPSRPGSFAKACALDGP